MMTRALAEAGATLEDVISTRVLVASTKREDLVTAWAVVRDGDSLASARLQLLCDSLELLRNNCSFEHV